MSERTTAGVRRLLERWRDKRGGDEYGDDFPQKLKKASAIADSIPTLAKGKLQPMTPMLAARFTMAGEWKNGWLGMTWLSLANMKQAWRDDNIVSQIQTRRDYWEGSVLSLYESCQLSLFSIDPVEQSECYLVWAKPGKEPGVAWYVDQQEHLFANFKKYLESLLDE